MWMILVGILFITLYVLRSKYLSQTRELREYGNKIPGPKPLPIFGNALEFGFSTKSIFNYILWLTKNYGPIVRVWIGPKLGILLADPHCIEALLGNSKNMNKSSLYQVAEPWLGKGLLISEGLLSFYNSFIETHLITNLRGASLDVWKKQRKIVAPTFQGQILSKFIDVFNSNLEVLIEKLSYHQNGSEFDIYPYLNLFAFDVICESAMGLKSNAQLQSNSEYVKAVSCMENIIFLRAFKPWLQPDILFRLSSLGRQQSKHLRTALNMTKQIILEHRQKRCTESNITDKTGHEENEEAVSISRKPFLEYLLDCIENGTQLTNVQLEDEVNSIMFAQNAVEEIDAVFGDSMRYCTSQDLTELKYLEQIIKESFRILPPVTIFGRKLTEDIKSGKYIFPAGSEVGVNVYMLHRHPDYFPDPEKFDPDRFLPENCVGRHPYCYLPFGGGPRICLGYKYAVQEMKTTMAQILRHFKILPAENPYMDLDLMVEVIMKPRNGIRIRLEPRNKQKKQ